MLLTSSAELNVVIDSDQSHSGASAASREGYPEGVRTHDMLSVRA